MDGTIAGAGEEALEEPSWSELEGQREWRSQ